jgi:hypothetical protein
VRPKLAIQAVREPARSGARSAPKGSGLQGCSHPQIGIKNKIVVTMILTLLRHFHFSRNQPPKLTDGCYIRILKNKFKIWDFFKKIKQKHHTIIHCNLKQASELWNMWLYLFVHK